jgi:ferritin-like metal-binding protein YciE
MFEHFDTPQDAYNYKLGATLKMERKVLEILEDSADKAQDEKVRRLFAEHHKESEAHVTVVEEVFGLFEWDVDESACPAIEGLEKEGKALAKKADDVLIDSILLQSALEVEHHEIGVYENLIINANAMGREDVVARLEENLRSEQSALEKVRALQAEVAAVTPEGTPR